MLPNTSFDMRIPSRYTFRLESSPPSLPEGKYEPRGTGRSTPASRWDRNEDATADLVDPPPLGGGMSLEGKGSARVSLQP